MDKEYEVVIVGAGTMGMATGAFLARQNVRTLLIDAFDPPHSHGSHHGDTRMIRHAYGEGRQYVTLVKRAQELWEKLEQESDYKIFEKTGVLGMGIRDSAFMNETIQAAQKFELPLEILSARDIMNKWPGIVLPDHFIGALEPDTGFLYSENCIQAYKDIARHNGAELVKNTPVLGIEPVQNKVKVTTVNGTFLAGKVIVTAGAWTGKLLESFHLPLNPLRKVFGWFDAPTDLYDVTRFPSFYLDEGDRMFYGFPDFGGGGLKLGRTDGGQPISPDQHTQNFGAYHEDEGELREFLGAYMPEANGALKQGQACLQTWSPDSHFIIDQHPEDENIIIAAGFSGHGFKFGSVIGEALSQMVTLGKTEHDLSLFSLERFKER